MTRRIIRDLAMAWAICAIATLAAIYESYKP